MSEEEKLEQVRLLNARNIYNAYKDLGLNPSESSIAKDLLTFLEQEDKESKRKKEQQEIDVFGHRLKKLSMKKSIGVSDVFYRVSKGNLPKEAFAKRIGIFMVLGGVRSLMVQQLVNGSKKAMLVRDFLNHYEDEIFEKYTQKNFISVMDFNYQTNDYYSKEKMNYNYDMEAIIRETMKKYSNPILSFYLIYTHLEDLEQHFDAFLTTFNQINGTDYASFENFLYKNHFINEAEFKNSAMELIEKEVWVIWK